MNREAQKLGLQEGSGVIFEPWVFTMLFLLKKTDQPVPDQWPVFAMKYSRIYVP